MISDLFARPELVLHEVSSSWNSLHRYDLLTPDLQVLGGVEESGHWSRFLLGTMAASRYAVRSGDDVVLTIDRPGRTSRFEFSATTPDGSALGTVRQENVLGAPRLQVQAQDGRIARLVGGSWGSRDWTLTLHERPDRLRKEVGDGRVVGAVTRRRRSFSRAFVDADTFTIRTDPALDAGLRALVLTAVVGLDAVRDDRKKSSGD